MKESLIEKKIYKIISQICEQKVAEKTARQITIELLAVKKKKIFKVLTTKPVSTKELAKILKMPSKNVSAALIQLQKSSSLISSNRKGKLRFWYKNDSDYIAK